MDSDKDFLDRLVKGDKPDESDFVPSKDSDCLKHSANIILEEGVVVRDSKPEK